MQLIKNLILGIVLAVAVQGLYKDKLSNQDIFTIAGLAMAVLTAINLLWIESPQTPPPIIEEEVPDIKQAQATNDLALMRRIMRKLFSECAMRSKLYMNSFLTNHIDKQIWRKLLVQSKQQIGEVLGRPQITQAMLHHLGEKEEVLSALYSENASRVKASIQRLHDSAEVLSKSMSSLGGNYTDIRRQIRELDEYFIQMALARLEQNWLRDADLFTNYYDEVMKMADSIAKVLV